LLLGILVLNPATVFAQLFGSDDKKFDKIAREIKKVNARLIENIVPELKNIKNAQAKIRSNQANLASQFDTLKNSLPGLQGSVEQTNEQVTQRLLAMEGRLENLETQMQSEFSKQVGTIKSELTTLSKNQNEQLGKLISNQRTEMGKLVGEQKAEMKGMQEKVGSHLTNINQVLVREIEGLAKKNDTSLKSFVTQNNKNSQKVQTLLNTQLKQIEETRTRIKVMKDVLAEIVKLENSNKESINQSLAAIQSGQDQNNAGFAQIQGNSKVLDDKNQKVIEVVKNSLKEQQQFIGKVDTLAVNLSKANENINSTKTAMLKLKEIIDRKLAEIAQAEGAILAQAQESIQNTNLVKENLLVADQKMNKLADGMKTLQVQNNTSASTLNSVNEKMVQLNTLTQQTDQKFVKLVDATKSMLGQTSKLGEKVDVAARKIDSGQTEAKLTHTKVAKLIEILKAMAAEQEKFKQVLNSQGGQFYDAVAKSQTELGKYITNSKVELGQFISGSQDEVKKKIDASRAENQKALTDLRKKANVNISRNDRILKALGAGKK